MSIGTKIIYHQSRQVIQTRSHIALSSTLGRTAGAIVSACIDEQRLKHHFSPTRLFSLVAYAPFYAHLRQLRSHAPARRTRNTEQETGHTYSPASADGNLHLLRRHEGRLTNTNKLIFIVARFIAQDIQALSLPLLGNFHKILEISYMINTLMTDKSRSKNHKSKMRTK